MSAEAQRWLRLRYAGHHALWTGATLLARFILGVVFALSAASKITTPGLFRADVAAYHLLPPELVGPVALLVPWLEALLALYLLIGLFLRPTAVVTAALLAGFTGILVISLVRGDINHSCGCLPTSGLLGVLPLVQWLAGGSTITLFDVARDLVFMALAGVICWGNRAACSIDGLLFGPGNEVHDEAAPSIPSGSVTTIIEKPRG